MTLYGIKNCDTVRKARKWLEAEKIEYTFHDFREDGLSEATVAQWANVVGWETLFNKRSTSFRGLTDAEKIDISEDKAITLMVQHPTLIKRPVLVNNDKLLVGFNLAQYQAWFA
ncbi:ArsC family reductase [Shewanella livingstonensis]|uniref:ArsC family reductase n=1 Tax=Shewanella livingstonensis TaxID=150120 RepID=A0A3G8LW12_9GAMM|nr:ArsC family reductase [Shewanella livingstonensis]AZG73584.1 ArsC family reductase [Shewanella livingstonensis]